MILRDKYGWPVEVFGNRAIANIISRILHTDFVATWRYRNWDGTGIDPGPRYDWMIKKNKSIEPIEKI
jgi:hypothetical protein